MIARVYLVVELFTIIYCLFALYGKKFQLDINTIIMMGINLIWIQLVNEDMIPKEWNVISYLIIFVYCFLEFDKDFKKAVVNNFLYVIIVSLFELIGCIPIAVFEQVFGSILGQSKLLALIINLLTLLIVFLLDWKKSLHLISDYALSKDWLYHVILLLCLFWILNIIQRFRIDQYFMVEFYFISLCLIILLVVLIVKWQQSRNQLLRQKLELEMYTVYNQAFDDLIQNIRRKQHDYKNHINAIYSQHYTCKTYEELVARQREYCEYIDHDSEFDRLLRINIPILSGFLYSKFLEAKEKQIQITYSICEISGDFGMPLYEMVTILGILLDNAFEALEGKPVYRKQVQFLVQDTEEKILVSVKNMGRYISSEQFCEMFKEGRSSKGAGRGIGLFNAKQKALKYDMDLIAENEKIEGSNWICFRLEMQK